MKMNEHLVNKERLIKVQELLTEIQNKHNKSLIGKEEGTTVAVLTPGGTKHYEILSIEIIST